MSTASLPATRASRSRDAVGFAFERSRSGRRRWAIALAAAFVGSVAVAGVGGELVNTRGWSNVARFWRAAVRPEMGSDFLALAARSAATTLGFAILGTGLSVLIGVTGAPVLAARFWETDGVRRPVARFGAASARALTRLAGILPRSVTEIVWALLLAQVFGPAPLVAVLAIGIPFGAVTASVFADTIDESDARPFRHLREHGSGRLAALAIGVWPLVRADLISYAAYRFECGIRAAAVLGIVGAGGLGYQIDLSFQTLRYGEMWTMIWTLVAVAAVADTASSGIRRRQRGTAARCGDVRLGPGPGEPRSGGRHAEPPAGQEAPEAAMAAGVPSRSALSLRSTPLALFAGALAVAAWWWVDLDPGIVAEPRRRSLLVRLGDDLFPPRLGPEGWWGLARACVDTLAMSILAIALSVAVGIVFAVIAARPARDALGRSMSPAAAVAWACRLATRFVALVARTVPPPVWVFLSVLVLYPGPWPGIVALGFYNAGVMSRLFAETLEDAEQRPAEALRASGAGPLQVFAYAMLPMVAPRLVALSIYRWEVIMRETVIVGVVGAAGLGRLIKDDLVARDFGALTTALLALVALTTGASLFGSRVRASLR